MYFLAIYYGAYENWTLTEYDSAQKVLDAVKSGESYGQAFKILKEVELTVEKEEER